jgi:hypothetical protein
VHLDGGLFNSILDQEVGYLAPLVTLELDDLTHLFVVNKGAIAGKFLEQVDERPDQRGYD